MSKDGSLVFNFPRDFRLKLATKSTAGKAKAKFEEVSKVKQQTRNFKNVLRTFLGFSWNFLCAVEFSSSVF